ncbi:hypothetical protein [Ktedonospora formicarum]|uniref:hypothetical protein n=1 Tax=Ktedonospora formicarum TaxID=2778364 RepID=UPI001C6941B0|nr:hypothetical protein [Ktedonospora formicarum]
MGFLSFWLHLPALRQRAWQTRVGDAPMGMRISAKKKLLCHLQAYLPDVLILAEPPGSGPLVGLLEQRRRLNPEHTSLRHPWDRLPIGTFPRRFQLHSLFPSTISSFPA